MGTNRRYPREQPPGRHRRHCWVLATAHERGPWPGLILEWRRTNSGDWSARVVYVPNPHEHRSVEAWFASGLLRPIDSWPSRATVDEAQHIDVHGM